MKRMLIAAALLVASTSWCAAGGITIASITAKELKRDSGNVWVSLSVEVINNSDIYRPKVLLEAVDKDGHTMKHKGLTGTIPPGTRGTLTDAVPVSEYEFERIKGWQLAR